MTLAIPAATLKALAVRSDGKGIARLAGHLTAIAMAAAAVVAARGTAWVWPAMAALGVLEVGLFAPLHETTHRTPFRSLWLNRVVGWLAGFLLVLPPEGFRLFHLAHHRHAQDVERDPELIGVTRLTRARYWLVLSGLPYWRAQVLGLLRTASGRADQPWIPAGARSAVALEARVYLGLYAALAVAAAATQSAWPLLLWVGPVLLGQPVLRAVLLAEHNGCPLNDDDFANTRTTLAGLAVRRLFWNANFHIEHHLAPGVPFHALPALHGVVRDRLKSVAPGYVAAHHAIRAALAGG